MKDTRLLHLALVLFSCLYFHAGFPAVTESSMDAVAAFFAAPPTEKMSELQRQRLERVLHCRDKSLRVASYNLLFDLYDHNLPEKHRWPERQKRVIEHLRHLDADIIGTQELQRNQLDELLKALKGEYAYFGCGNKDSGHAGDFDVILYRAERIELVRGTSHAVPGESQYGTKFKLVHCCQFRDRKTNRQCMMLNTHLSFGNMANRHKEAQAVARLVQRFGRCLPVIFSADCNTFPLLPERSLPAYDGKDVLSVLTSTGLCNSSERSESGHFGPLSTSSFCEKSQVSFINQGTPGVILDHIFVSNGITVVSHVHDAARVDGEYASDHFPVVVDIVLP